MDKALSLGSPAVPAIPTPFKPGPLLFEFVFLEWCSHFLLRRRGNQMWFDNLERKPKNEYLWCWEMTGRQRGCSWAGGECLFSSDAHLTSCVVKIRLSESLHMQICSPEVVYGTCSCFPGQPCQTFHEEPANQDGKQGMGGQVGPFSCQHRPSSPSIPSSVPTITALPFVLPSFTFIAQSLCPSGCLWVRWGHWTLPPPHAEASASSCQQFALQGRIVMGVMCKHGRKKKKLPYSPYTSQTLRGCILYNREYFNATVAKHSAR